MSDNDGDEVERCTLTRAEWKFSVLVSAWLIAGLWTFSELVAQDLHWSTPVGSVVAFTIMFGWGDLAEIFRGVITRG